MTDTPDEPIDDELDYGELEDADLNSQEVESASADETEVAAHEEDRQEAFEHEEMEQETLASTMDSDSSLPPIELPPRVEMQGPPSGICRADAEGYELLDACAGRISVFGFGFDPIIEAIQAASDGFLGDDASQSMPAADDGVLHEELSELFAGSSLVPHDSLWLCPAADLAIEQAIYLARIHRPEQAFRTVALLGSDHGRTGLCRSASGRPELHEDFGPMMAGFAHVPPNDVKALRSVVDEQTACVLVSPVDLQDGARLIDGEYLAAARAACDEFGALLIIDETRIPFGSSGQPFAFTSIAEVRADIVVASAGLFGGLPGGIVLANPRVSHGKCVIDTARYPLLSVVVSETCAAMKQQGLPAAAEEAMQAFAVAMAEQLSGFEFIRDVNVLGMTMGIEADIESSELIRKFVQQGVQVDSAGDTAIRLHLPLVFNDEDQLKLLEHMQLAMEMVERETKEMSI